MKKSHEPSLYFLMQLINFLKIIDKTMSAFDKPAYFSGVIPIYAGLQKQTFGIDGAGLFTDWTPFLTGVRAGEGELR